MSTAAFRCWDPLAGDGEYMSAGKRTLGIRVSPIDHSWLVVMRCRRTNGKSCENQLKGRDRSTCRICVPDNWTATEKALFRPDLLEDEEKAVVTTQHLEGEVTAFRGWHLGFDGQSYSLVSDYLLDPAYWTPGQPLKAQCHRRLGDDDHEPPHRECRCGLYAAKKPTDAIGNIIGTVAMWGRYVEHERGWRAEYAYPKSVTKLKCFECSQVFPWGTMKYLTRFTEEPVKEAASRRHDWLLKPSSRERRFRGRCGTALRDAQALKEYFFKRCLLESPQRPQGTQVIPKTVLACADCICGSKLNGDWLPASHLIERIEHTYGLEVN